MSDAMFCTEAWFGALRVHDWFRTDLTGLERGDQVILRTPRGVEVGQIVTPPEQRSGDEPRPEGEVLRRFESSDEARVTELHARAASVDFDTAKHLIKQQGLDMRLVHVEHLFGGGKVVFYFVADGRVDFRELVKDLAREFRTRIELRQIGVRDEAKIVGDLEYCGRDLCCLAWIREIQPVTMRMAKNQKSTLDPNKISGRCSRLKCCLRFEDEVYREFRNETPRVGTIVETERGQARVVSRDPMARTLTVMLESREHVTLPCSSVCPCGASKPDIPQAKSE